MKRRRGNKRPIGYLLIFGIGIVLIFTLVVLSRSGERGVAVETPGQEGADRVVASDQDVPRISLKNAKEMWDTGDAVFIDVRSSSAYQSAHIPGALSIEINDIERATAAFDRERLTITYCT